MMERRWKYLKLDPAMVFDEFLSCGAVRGVDVNPPLPEDVSVNHAFIDTCDNTIVFVLHSKEWPVVSPGSHFHVLTVNQ